MIIIFHFKTKAQCSFFNRGAVKLKFIFMERGGNVFGLGAKELVIILAIILVIFGPSRVPQIGRSLGRGLGEFKESVGGGGHSADKREEI